MSLRNVVAVANAKGGVGKSSLAANIGGVAAASGWPVLVIDLDSQGNLGRDYGYRDSPDNDRGEGLRKAVLGGGELVPRRNVRPGLDVITAGDATDEIEHVLGFRHHKDQQPITALVAALESLASRYSLIILDCPPRVGILLDTALTTARFLLIPTKGDAGSLDGLERVATRFAQQRETTNPDLTLLGVVLFDFGAHDKLLVAQARSQLAELPVLEPYVRHSRKGAQDMRSAGLLAHEYEEAARTPSGRWRFSSSAEGLAADYQAITEIVCTAVAGAAVAAIKN